MLTSLETVATVQGADTARAPGRIARAPVRNTALEGFRRRNTLLDAVFYDVSVISAEEAAGLVPWLAAEGAVLVVPPSEQGAVEVHATIEDFAKRAGPPVSALAIAGVGSSALGGAALARNVADATGAPVAAVVSGYGVSDVLTEALGGWFWFGTINRLRHSLEVAAGAASKSGSQSLVSVSESYASADTLTVAALLSDARFDFRLLVAHSKGNLVMAEALYAAERVLAARGAGFPEDLLVVTLGAVITMPRSCRRVIDVMGVWDGLGRANSRPDIRVDVPVPWAGHHTNTEIPGHVCVRTVLSKILADPAPQPTPVP
jgi:hypothetical protein